MRRYCIVLRIQNGNFDSKLKSYTHVLGDRVYFDADSEKWNTVISISKDSKIRNISGWNWKAFGDESIRLLKIAENRLTPLYAYMKDRIWM